MNLTPLVSIGLPVYNEEQYLDRTIESLLKQDYSNIEIIISDNASTDGTSDICMNYSSKEDRVRYLRQEQNIGLGANFRVVLEEAKGTYFLWACGHDLWSDNYVTDCVKVLEDNPDAVIAVPSSHWIGPDDKILHKYSGYNDTRGMDVMARYFTIFWGNMHACYGLLRLQSMGTWKVREIVGEDLVLLTYLSFVGDFIHVPAARWYRREFRFEKSYNVRINRYKEGQQKITRSRFDRLFPFARLTYALVYEVVKARTSMLNKIFILALLPLSFVARFYSGRKQYEGGDCPADREESTTP